ncbi:PLP-dependent aminotransferase family protein [Terracidiphilus sp.]|jgi:GntR family transcriptional regulator/MocR family aminotransferase|uniref:MocR-like pyridoxine biosynthesis transcription factor PdxR n=1 Tax=Terracidiphilus sp. TaxID=1964191 RepID=UPI003C14B06D
MSHLAASISPIIAIDRDAERPLHQQVYDGYREAILRGDLQSGQKIPSSRELAAEIGVSRFPVLHAYAQLKAEGYFESHVGSGTIISATLPEQMMPSSRGAGGLQTSISGRRPIARRTRFYPRFERDSHLRGWGAFGIHQPAFDHFPFQVWSGLVAKHSRNPHASAIHNINPLGSERFREEICAYLRTARAVKCDASQIMIVSGSQQALDITARVLLNPGDPVLVEEPGYNLERTVLAAAGCRLQLVPVDHEGMDVVQGVKRHPGAKAAFVTPSHQFPLGSTMSATRRLLLLNWAQSSGAWVIEDDYDSEYRFDARPIASLQGLDVNSRVIYIGTFSKILFPSLRIGYIVIPQDLVSHFAAVRFAMDIFPPYLYQEVLSDFMSQDYFGRHIRKMRQVYSARRAMLIDCLRTEFGDKLQVHGSAAGMHVTVTLPEGFDDLEIAARTIQQRLWLWPLSPYYLGKQRRSGFVLGFGSTAEEQIPTAVKRMRSVILG